MSEEAKKYSYKVSLGSHDSRLKSGSAQEVVDYCYAPRLKGPMPTFPYMIQYNLAHVLELNRGKVVSTEDAKALLEGLKWMREQGLEHFELDPRLESLMPNLEAILISRIGAEAGGQVLTGRSRGEVEAVSGILLLRAKLLELLEEIHRLRAVLIEVARKHADTVMPGYTHLQHAQPTTLGHYLACVATALEMDCSRLTDAYARLNMSPAETGTSWGSSYPIDRKTVADLLGFEGMIENTRYAYSSGSDKATEIVAALSMLAVSMNRFSEDLYFWCTPEYMMADVADEYAGTSYIMPQKKNVTALQHYTTLVNRINTAFLRLSSQAARCSFGIGANLAVTVMNSAGEAWTALEDVLGGLRLLRGLTSTISFNEEVMKDRAGIHFTQGTELADTLFREKGIPFRTAHRIVGTLVRRALAERKSAMDIDETMLNDAAAEVTGRPIAPPCESLWKALEPMGIVSAHTGAGGVAPSAVRTSLKNLEQNLDRERQFVSEKKKCVSDAAQKLEAAVDALMTSG